jgi:hypothetical protein
LKRARKLKNNSSEQNINISDNEETLDQLDSQSNSNVSFPPSPPSDVLQKIIIKDFCEATASKNFEESGCTVCGALTLQLDLFEINFVNNKLSVLAADGLGFTQQE